MQVRKFKTVIDFETNILNSYRLCSYCQNVLCCSIISEYIMSPDQFVIPKLNYAQTKLGLIIVSDYIRRHRYAQVTDTTIVKTSYKVIIRERESLFFVQRHVGCWPPSNLSMKNSQNPQREKGWMGVFYEIHSMPEIKDDDHRYII